MFRIPIRQRSNRTLRVVMSADGTKFVYGYQKHQSELYVATGLR